MGQSGSQEVVGGREAEREAASQEWEAAATDLKRYVRVAAVDVEGTQRERDLAGYISNRYRCPRRALPRRAAPPSRSCPKQPPKRRLVFGPARVCSKPASPPRPCPSFKIEGVPTIVTFKPTRKPGARPLAEVYTGERKAKAVSEHCRAAMPSFVSAVRQRVTFSV
jgi:hypothetical protein